MMTLSDLLGRVACSSPFLVSWCQRGRSSSSRSPDGDLHLGWEFKHVLLSFLRACASVCFRLWNLPFSFVFGELP
jgi:hypothetical protein